MIEDDRKCMEDQPDKDHYLQEEKASPTREQLHYTIMIRWRNVTNNKNQAKEFQTSRVKHECSHTDFHKYKWLQS